jgi:hypothetical protein
MNRCLALLACFVATPALATSHVIEFNILPCPTAPSNIGSTYDDPFNHTTWDADTTERFYASCSQFNSPALSADRTGNLTAFTVENTTSLVMVVDSMWLAGAPGPLGPLVSSVTISSASNSAQFDLSNGGLTATFEGFRGLRPGEMLTVVADGALLFDDFAYQLEDDRDNDGYVEAEGDCDDLNPTRNPGANDVPGDGIDQDCDGLDAVSTSEFKAVVAMPSCPLGGTLHIVWSGGAPSGRVQILPAQPGTTPSVWAGPDCAGRLLGLTPSLVPPVRTSGTGGTGYFGLPTAGANLCGFEIQLLDLDTCTLSDVMTVQ